MRSTFWQRSRFFFSAAYVSFSSVIVIIWNLPFVYFSHIHIYIVLFGFWFVENQSLRFCFLAHCVCAQADRSKWQERKKQNIFQKSCRHIIAFRCFASCSMRTSSIIIIVQFSQCGRHIPLCWRNLKMASITQSERESGIHTASARARASTHAHKMSLLCKHFWYLLYIAALCLPFSIQLA